MHFFVVLAPDAGHLFVEAHFGRLDFDWPVKIDILGHLLYFVSQTDDSLLYWLAHFFKIERHAIFGQDARLAHHALHVGDEDKRNVVLEDGQVQVSPRIALHQTFPHTDADHAQLDCEHHKVSDTNAHYSGAFAN